jgi:hypothetical protein
MHLSGFQLAISEHCAKTGKKVTSSNSRKAKVGAAKFKLGLPLGISDRNHCRYVCCGDTTGECLFQADVWCRQQQNGKFVWVCEWLREHTCNWCVADAKVTNKANHLKGAIKNATQMLQTATEMHTKSPTATSVVGLKHVEQKVAEQTKSLRDLGHSAQSGTHYHRPYGRLELARGLLDKVLDGEAPSATQALDHIFELTGRSEDRRFATDIIQAAMEMHRKREMVDSLEFLPEYLQCLRDKGWFVQLFTCTAAEMATSVGRILQREWNERCKRNADLTPMNTEACINLLDFGESKFTLGWLASPPNHAPTHAVRGLNEANRPEVRLIDACHMKVPGNVGTLYSGYKPDANRSLDALGFVFRTDVENLIGWELAKSAIEAHEPPQHQGGQAVLFLPPGSPGEPILSTLVHVGDGDKGIAEAFRNVVRCCFHRQQNFALAFPKKLAQKEVYAKAHRAASAHTFQQHFKHLTHGMQQWARKLDLKAWAQSTHRQRLYGHFNGPETMNSKPLKTAREAPNMLATLKEIVHMVSRRDRQLALQAANWTERFPPRVLAKIAQAQRYEEAMPSGCVEWLDKNLRRHARVRQPDGHINTCKITVASVDRAYIECDCGFPEREGWCWCAYLLCVRGNTVAWQHIIPMCLRTEAWRESHPSNPAWLPPTPEEIATVDASAIRQEAGLAKGEVLLSPVAIPRAAGRPAKEYYIRYDHAATRMKKAKNPTTTVNTAGLKAQRSQRQCKKCGGYGHTQKNCAKFGFVIDTLGPLEQAQTAAAMNARPPLIDSWPGVVQEPQTEAQAEAPEAAAPQEPAPEATTPEAEAPTTEAEAPEAKAPEEAPTPEVAAPEAEAPTTEAEAPTTEGHAPTWTRSPLTSGMIAVFTNACEGPHDQNRGTVQHSSKDELLPFRTADLRTLRPGTWISNYVINNYFHLVVSLHKQWPGLPRCRILKEIEIAKYFIDPHFQPLGELKK